MPKNDIGGFFVSLGLNIDKQSFETGNKLIDGIGNGFNKLIGSARNASVVLAGTAIASSKVESSAYRQSVAMGISAESLEAWKASAKIAGIDANGLVTAMSRMAEVMNHLQIDGTIEEVNSPLPLDKKFEAFNWNVITIDGHNFDEIEAAVKAAEECKDKPTAIIANTIKGKDVSYMENQVDWHGSAPNNELTEQALAELDSKIAAL